MGFSEPTGHLTTDELFRRYAGFVARFLTRLGVPSEQLEDSLQEVFLVVHRNGGYRPGIAKPTSYLANVAIRAAHRHRQRQNKARNRHCEHPVEQVPSELEDPAHALQVRQDLRRLQRALDRLPEDLRTTLLLVEMEGESCVSVAAGLSCPVGTVYSRLHVARKRLQAALNADPACQVARAAAASDKQPQPARSLLMLLGLGGFDRTEAARLLRLARNEQFPTLDFDQLLAFHKQLVASGASLPASYGCAPSAASWMSIVGAGPLAGAVTVGALAVGTSLLVLSAAVPEPTPHVYQAVAAVETSRAAHSTVPRRLVPDPGFTRARSKTAQGGAPAGVVGDVAGIDLRSKTPKRSQPRPTSKGAPKRAKPEFEAVERRKPSHEAAAARVGPRPSLAAPSNGADLGDQRQREPHEGGSGKATGEASFRRGPATTPGIQAERRDANSDGQAAVQDVELAKPPTRQPRPNAVADGPASDAEAHSDRNTGTAARGEAFDDNAGVTARKPLDAELQELRDSARAERLLSSDPRDALALTQAMRARFPEGNLREERAYIEVMALLELQRTRELRTKAAAFLDTYPDGPYSGRVRAALTRDVE